MPSDSPKFSNLIPIPYVTTTVSTAIQILQIVKSIRSNVEGSQEFSDRVSNVTLVVMSTLNGKSEREIRNDLKQTIERLTKDLLAIERDVRRIRDRTDTTKLLSQLEVCIHDSLCTAQISLHTAHMADTLGEPQHSIQDIPTDVPEIKDAIQWMEVGPRTLDVGPRPSHPSAAIPPGPEIFHDRTAR
ncbi:hypothetical protein FRB96_005533 [Tulasnella sp. 330]|nr:hypothetical protein FRB96_005533 [Tulasnella sp. 330]